MSEVEDLQKKLVRYKRLMHAEMSGQQAHREGLPVEACPESDLDEERVLWLAGWDRMETIKIASRVDELETMVMWTIDSLEEIENRVKDPEHPEKLAEDIAPKISSVSGKLKDYLTHVK